MLNLNHLRVFHAAAGAGGFTRAAELLHLTQPGISKHVRDLEEHYGTRLFERRGKAVALTAAGEILFEATKEMTACLERAGRRIGELQGRGPALALAATFTVGLHVVPERLATFRGRHPDLEVGLNLFFAADIEAKLAEPGFDLALVGHEIRNPKLVATEFCSDELVLILSPTHKWAERRGKVSLGELADQPFIVASAGAGTRRMIEDRLKQNGASLSRLLDFGNMEGVKRAVEAGLGLSILSRTVVEREVATGRLRALPLAGRNMRRRFYVVRRKDRRLSDSARVFMEFLCAAAPA